MLESFYPNYIPSYISFQVYGVTSLYMFPFVCSYYCKTLIFIYISWLSMMKPTSLTLCVSFSYTFLFWQDLGSLILNKCPTNHIKVFWNINTRV